MANETGSIDLNKHNTYADFKKWNLPEGERYELINGDVYLKPAPEAYHQSIINKLYKQMSEFLNEKSVKVFSAPFTVRLFFKEDESDDTVVLPDITIICDPANCAPEGFRGAPDFIAEILSASVSAIELDEKIQSYQNAGVREYWLLDPIHKSLTIHNFWEDIIFPKYYKSTESAKVGLFEDLIIPLGSLFSE